MSSALWRHWKVTLGVTSENTFDNLLQLFKAIETIFGTGYGTIGEQAVKKLYAKANIPLKHSHNKPLVEYVKELKQILTREAKSRQSHSQ